MRIALGAFALFLLTCVLVAAGAFTSLDQYAVSHLMPWLAPGHRPRLESLTLPPTGGSPAFMALELWTYPAAVLPSALIVGACAWTIRTPVPAVLWVAGNAIEVIGKAVVERPALYDGTRHVTGFDHALPSGHTIRSLLVAAAVAAVWRRYGRLAWVWAAGTAIALVPTGDHVPMDVVAGLFVATALIAGASFRPSWRLRP